MLIAYVPAPPAIQHYYTFSGWTCHSVMNKHKHYSLFHYFHLCCHYYLNLIMSLLGGWLPLARVRVYRRIDVSSRYQYVIQCDSWFTVDGVHCISISHRDVIVTIPVSICKLLTVAMQLLGFSCQIKSTIDLPTREQCL